MCHFWVGCQDSLQQFIVAPSLLSKDDALARGGISPSLRSDLSHPASPVVVPFALVYENGNGFLMSISTSTHTVTKKVPLPSNPSQDFQLRQSMDGQWFVSSPSLGVSYWVAWWHYCLSFCLTEFSLGDFVCVTSCGGLQLCGWSCVLNLNHLSVRMLSSSRPNAVGLRNTSQRMFILILILGSELGYAHNALARWHTGLFKSPVEIVVLRCKDSQQDLAGVEEEAASAASAAPPVPAVAEVPAKAQVSQVSQVFFGTLISEHLRQHVYANRGTNDTLWNMK